MLSKVKFNDFEAISSSLTMLIRREEIKKFKKQKKKKKKIKQFFCKVESLRQSNLIFLKLLASN